MINLKRGNEWISIQQLNTRQVLWLYGEGKVGNGRCVCPLEVLESQVEAHQGKGWVKLEDS